MDEIAKMVAELEALLAALPGTNNLIKELEELRHLLLEQRAPRFALVGRRGSGKSSLINAIFGQKVAEVGHVKAKTGRGKWWAYSGDLGSIDILDTRGLQEGGKPDEEDDAEDPLESILRALEEKTPDAVLFLVKAKEVDSAIDGDIDALVELRNKAKGPMPIVGIVTHADEMEPKNVKLHDEDAEDAEDIREKEARVQEAIKHIEEKIRARPELKDDFVAVVGVSSYMSWRADGTLRADERWRINALLEYLIQELPDQAQVMFARLSRVRNVQRRIAIRLTQLISGLTAAVAAAPIPVADLAPITALQISLISGIAYISGREMSTKTAMEFLGAIGLNVGAGFAFREAARALVKLIPGFGSVVSSAVAGAATFALGKAAIAYFIDDKSAEDAKDVFNTENKTQD